MSILHLPIEGNLGRTVILLNLTASFKEVEEKELNRRNGLQVVGKMLAEGRHPNIVINLQQHLDSLRRNGRTAEAMDLHEKT